jgi:uncharacterized protein YutE (UPF0331/DUF86 family)
MNEVVTNKIQSIQLCITRAREEYQADPDHFATNYTRQDAAILNVIRACEQAIDLANHVIKNHKMGVPTSSAESFEVLQRQGIIDDELAKQLKKMVCFRNLVIHRYQKMDLEIVKTVILSGLEDLITFGDRILAFTEKRG